MGDEFFVDIFEFCARACARLSQNKELRMLASKFVEILAIFLHRARSQKTAVQIGFLNCGKDFQNGKF